MEKLRLELRQGEGGRDAKLIVEDMAAMYIKAAEKQNFSVGVNH